VLYRAFLADRVALSGPTSTQELFIRLDANLEAELTDSPWFYSGAYDFGAAQRRISRFCLVRQSVITNRRGFHSSSFNEVRL
jgi:hypothetical protein